MTATASRTWKTADEIAALFTDRLDDFGVCRLTVKQTQWLVGQWRREMSRYTDFRWDGRHATGNLSGGVWDLAILSNGSGIFKTR